MRTYFHFSLTCPSCHEPHLTGNPVKKLDDNIFKCSSCMAIFRSHINLTPYTETVNHLNTNPQDESPIELPLLWKVSSNPVESSYIEWLSSAKPEGKYLVTWPWQDVKFIPIMISEYLLQNPEKTVAVIGNTEKLDDDISGIQRLNELFDKIIYLDDYEESLNDSLRCERNKFDRQEVLFKTDRTYYAIRKIGSDEFEKGRLEGVFDGTPTRCKNKIFKDLEDDYGENCIRIFRKIPSNRKPKTLNTDGFFDVTVGTREEWTGQLKYNSTWLWQILFNQEKIRRPSLMIRNTSIFDEETEINPLKTGVYFISDKINPKYLFNLLIDLNPDTIIIADIDNFIIDQIYGGFKSKNLFSFLEKTNSNILMFSTKPDIRHLFRINSGYSILDKYDIQIHSWDSAIVTGKLEGIIEGKVSPLSSTREELPNYGNLPPIEYKPVKGLDKLDEVILIIKDMDWTYIRYIKDLKKTSLKVKGDYNRPEVFKRIFRDTIVHYDKMIGKIFRSDDKMAQDIMEIFNEIYDITGSFHNPVFDELTRTVDNLLQNERDNVTVVVHGLDVRGTVKLLEEKGFKHQIPNQLDVVSWKKLAVREHDIADDESHYVISLRPPSLDYQLYFSKNIKKFIFIGSENDLENTKKILENRLTDEISRPVICPGNSAPKLLRDILKKHDPDLMGEVKKDFFTETHEEEISFNDHVSDSARDGRTFRHRLLKKGDEAVLALNESGYCMFLPLKKSIFFRKRTSGTVEEINIKNDAVDKILKKDIIVDRRGVYTSFKHVFTRFMFEKARNIKIKSGFYQWDSFPELFMDSIEWIRVLRHTIKHIMRKYNMDEVQAEEKLSEFLSSLQLNAKNPDYIKNWWSYPEMIITDHGPIPVYDIEHPKSRHDLLKIYNGINNDLFPDMKLNAEHSERSYMAARTLQNLRRGFFKNQLKKIPSQYHPIYDNLRNEIQKIVDGSDSFTVSSAMVVRIKKDVHILETLNDDEALRSIIREE